MAEIIAVVGAITTASKLKTALEKKGCLKCRIAHTPSKISSGGCSYSVYLSDSCYFLLLEETKKCGINIKGIFRKYISNGKEFYDDLSG